MSHTDGGGRRAKVARKTSESDVVVELDLDGTGVTDISTGVPFYDHMLTALGKHSLMDLTVKATGDVAIDSHHTVEDVAICIGEAIKEALGDKAGISRFGAAVVPLDEALAQAVVDVSGRPYFVHVGEPIGQATHLIGGNFAGSLTGHVLESIAHHAEITLLPELPNLAVTRTMSKAFALAGGRLGYLAASPAIVDALRIVRLPYHLSSVTQAVARAALAHTDELQAQVALLRAERDALQEWLRARGHDVAESDANFVLFGRFDDRHAVWQGLLDRGVLIRETGPDRWLRVSVGTPEENAAFRAALEEVTA